MSIARYKSEANYLRLERKHTNSGKAAKYAARMYNRVVRHTVKLTLKHNLNGDDYVY